MAEYGSGESVSAEGWAITLFFAGLCMWVGGFAYAAAGLQALMAILGFALDGVAISLLWRAKPRARRAPREVAAAARKGSKS